MEDSEIIALLRRRDERGLREAENRYGAFCEGLARNLLGSRESAEECWSDALLRLWTSVPPERRTALTVVFEKGNVVYSLCADVPETQEEQAALDLRDLLLCYVGTHNTPDLSEFRCGEHVYRDEELTLAEALADPDFGAYLPETVPAS